MLGDFPTARDKLETGEFDVLLLSNVLHLVDDPVEVLSLFRETLSVDPTIIITSPNMRCASFYWSKLRSGNRIDHLGSYDLTGVRLSSSASVRRWCENAGLKVQKTVALGSYRVERIRRLIPTFARNFVPNFIQRFLASDLIVMATKHL